MGALGVDEETQKIVSDAGAKGKALRNSALGALAGMVGTVAEATGAMTVAEATGAMTVAKAAVNVASADSRDVKISAVVDVSRRSVRDDVEVVVQAIKTDSMAFDLVLQNEAVHQYINDACSKQATDVVNKLADAADDIPQMLTKQVIRQTADLKGTKLIVSAAAAVDERFSVESKAVSAGTTLLEKGRAFGERYNVKETATKTFEMAHGLDSQVTGGNVAPPLRYAFKKSIVTASEGLAAMRAEYDSAKRQQPAGTEASKEVTVEA